MSAKFQITPMIHHHWEQVSTIYQQGLDSRMATFQTEVPTYTDWDRSHLDTLRYVAQTSDQTILGWVAVSQVSSRKVYQGILEHSIYIADKAKGQGVGRALLAYLIDQSEQSGCWTLMASIFPENTASIKLHERLGFRKIGVREKIARHHGVWRDTWLYERRSPLF
ncbi:MAG: Putative phosphinothricin acetyltransferase YwnH [Candidatus Celerinatantimonas neptuna]|nr:MAG: Putative phosphinothricin acetyltransferase YwnH [Candidatus Celerinatantimonas neptuna]